MCTHIHTHTHIHTDARISCTPDNSEDNSIFFELPSLLRSNWISINKNEYRSLVCTTILDILPPLPPWLFPSSFRYYTPYYRLAIFPCFANRSIFPLLVSNPLDVPRSDVFFRIFLPLSYIYFLSTPSLIFSLPNTSFFTSFDIFFLFSQLKFFFLARILFSQQQPQLHRCPPFPIRSSIYAYPRVFHLFPPSLQTLPRLVISSYFARHNAFSSFPITFTRHHPSTFPFSQFLPPFSTSLFPRRVFHSPLSLFLSLFILPSPSSAQTVLPFFLHPERRESPPSPRRRSISLSPCQSTATYKFIALINLKYGIEYAQSLWTLMRPRWIRSRRSSFTRDRTTDCSFFHSKFYCVTYSFNRASTRDE